MPHLLTSPVPNFKTFILTHSSQNFAFAYHLTVVLRKPSGIALHEHNVITLYIWQQVSH